MINYDVKKNIKNINQVSFKVIFDDKTTLKHLRQKQKDKKETKAERFR